MVTKQRKHEDGRHAQVCFHIVTAHLVFHEFVKALSISSILEKDRTSCPSLQWSGDTQRSMSVSQSLSITASVRTSFSACVLVRCLRAVVG